VQAKHQEHMTQYNSSDTAKPCPPQPLPAPLLMSEKGSFAYFTLTDRLPAIVDRVISENEFSSDIVTQLQALREELPDGKIRPLKNNGGPDLSDWAEYVAPYLGQRWLDVPWYFAEAYFYRRLLEATRYFSAGPWAGLDPFQSQKRTGLTQAMDSVRILSKQIEAILSQSQQWNRTGFELLVYYELWGNRLDLSQKPDALTGHTENQLDLSQEQSNILIDDTPALAEKLGGLRGARIDLITDNAGFELWCDLGMADFLLTSGAAATIHLHLKSHPTFVSDATVPDVRHTLTILAADGNEEVQAVAGRLQHHLASDRLQLRDHFFWTTPLAFWEMPEPVRAELAQADLVFVKGDANYRRLMGDLQWPYTTPLADIVCYFPAPLVVLRTLKSELVVGLQSGEPERLAQEDTHWLTNGQRGVIQLGNSKI
jgi:uncharacterized protein with ATP-grasp and redox domains